MVEVTPYAMKHARRLLALLAILGAASAGAAEPAAAPNPPASQPAVSTAPRIGKTAPGIDVADLDGKTRTLAEFSGKVIVIEWLNPGCPFVKKFYGSGRMQEWQKQLTGKGVVWLSVVSTRKDHPEFRDAAALKTWITEQKAAPTAVLLDTDGAMARRYAAKTTPHMYVIGKDGRLAYAGAIDSIRTPRPDDIAKATPYLLNAVTAVSDGKPANPAETKAYGCGVKL